MEELAFKRMIYAIAAGLYERSCSPERYVFSSKLMYGIDKLAMAAAKDGQEQVLSELHEAAFLERYAARPIKDWFKGWSERFTAQAANYPLYNTGALAELYGDRVFGVTDECMELYGHTEKDLFNALSQLHVFQQMRELPADEYVAVRLFIAEHPMCSLRDIRSFKLRHNSPETAGILSDAYEDIPQDCYVCPECGWTMRFAGKRAVCCNSSCSRTHPTRADLERVSSSAEKRLTHGVMRYMCVPARLELEIREKAEKLGCKAELWPNNDEYDVKITLPDGRVWAIDAKTHRNPHNLAADIANDGRFFHVEAHERIYVVPNARKQECPEYCDVCREALKDNAKFMTDTELYRSLREAMRR